METATPSLLELQRALRVSLLTHDDRGISAHVVDAGMSPAERLDVYRNTFASVLTTALRLSYPAVHRLVGAEFFEGAARVFIEAHPPRNACLDDYGERLADFLSAFEPAASLAYLPDVARLEWTVNRALHASDAEPLDPRRLAVLAEAEKARVRFVLHPSVSLLRRKTARFQKSIPARARRGCWCSALRPASRSVAWANPRGESPPHFSQADRLPPPSTKRRTRRRRRCSPTTLRPAPSSISA